VTDASPKFDIDPGFLWSQFCQRAGVDMTVITDVDQYGHHPHIVNRVWDLLRGFYNEPGRAYHTMAHISWCLDLLREFFPEKKRPDWYNRVELALWFHDVIYDPKRKDNEARSARVLIGAAAMLGLDPSMAMDASEDVVATKHVGFFMPAHEATRWVLDIDLASLGFDPATFDRNSAQIREEYSFVPEDAYRAGRKAILQGFLDRPQIYLTPE
jgi:predicted metal-dependent HD superfamily phosphohydrolase